MRNLQIVILPIQQVLGEPNLFKIKYRDVIKDIIRKLSIENVTGASIVPAIKNTLNELNLSGNDKQQLFKLLK